MYSGLLIQRMLYSDGSVAYNLVLRAADRTLTVEEADAVVKKVLKALDAIGASLRS